MCVIIRECGFFYTHVYGRIIREPSRNWMPKTEPIGEKSNCQTGASRLETDQEATPRKSALHSVKAVSMPEQPAKPKPDRTATRQDRPHEQRHGTRQQRPNSLAKSANDQNRKHGKRIPDGTTLYKNTTCCQTAKTAFIWLFTALRVYVICQGAKTALKRLLNALQHNGICQIDRDQYNRKRSQRRPNKGTIQANIRPHNSQSSTSLYKYSLLVKTACKRL